MHGHFHYARLFRHMIFSRSCASHYWLYFLLPLKPPATDAASISFCATRQQPSLLSYGARQPAAAGSAEPLSRRYLAAAMNSDLMPAFRRRLAMRMAAILRLSSRRQLSAGIRLRH
jgi:hypothetical protein